MTDLEKLRELLDSWGVAYVEADREPKRPLRHMTDGPWHPKLHEVTVGGWDDAANNEKVDGYTGFYTGFQFTPEGEFVCMGAWE